MVVYWCACHTVDLGSLEENYVKRVLVLELAHYLVLYRHSVKSDEMNESNQAEGGVKVKDSSRILGLEEKKLFSI